MPISNDENETVVKLLLRRAGISPDAKELDELIESYPMLRAMLDSLFEVAGVSDGGPLPTFSLERFAEPQR